MTGVEVVMSFGGDEELRLGGGGVEPTRVCGRDRRFVAPTQKSPGECLSRRVHWVERVTRRRSSRENLGGWVTAPPR